MKRVGVRRVFGSTLGLGVIVCAGLVVGPLVAQVVITADGPIESQAGGLRFPDGSLQAAAATSAPVEDSGQRDCWDAVGASVSCTGTGQDGELQRGVAWPTPRFTDNGDGTVTDHLTGLIWLEDANCFGSKDWTNALSDAGSLMTGQCNLSDGSLATDWRLPNVNELLSLADYDESNPALPHGHPFDNVQTTPYWTSSTSLPSLTTAWVVYMEFGYTSYSDNKGNSRSVWPVRGGLQ